MPTDRALTVHVDVSFGGKSLDRIFRKLNRLENLMVSEVEAIAGVDVKVTALIADVRAVLENLPVTEELSEEGQAAIDALNAKLDAFAAEVGDADGSDTPPEPTA